MSRIWKFVAAVMALAGAGAAISQTPASLAPVAPVASANTRALPIVPPMAGQATLTRPDLEAWLDGFMPSSLAQGDIAGAVVVVVKDGQVLLQKGYGYSDVARRKPVSPEATLFRPGSVSKLFTWTAVMQLVEQGQLDLDRDVNDYLDFKIPPYDGKPITLRNILTHTAGFEETARYTILNKPMALDALLKASLPARIFPPGETPAYSNYATALAGYIVARRAGMSFDDYIEARVMRPIGMTRSTFRQPLPQSLKPLMSNGYALGSGKPQDFEFVGPAPAGSLSATGSDMAKFMIAHLNSGAGLLRPETATMMHQAQLTVLPPLNRMALGFYEQNLNGRRSIGHGGDTQLFHSDLSLFLDDNVGIYVSVNSTGKDGAAQPLRAALFHEFANRYFPRQPATTRVDAKTAREHAAMMAGTYAASRGIETNFLRILKLLGPTEIGVNEDGGLSVPIADGIAGRPRQWVEIAPFVWQDPVNGEKLAAKVVDGKVVRWSFDTGSPFMVFDRMPWYIDAAWLAPGLAAALGIVLLSAIGWPAGAIARRRYDATFALQGRRLGVYRATKVLAWLAVALIAAWVSMIIFGTEDLDFFSGPFVSFLIVLQFLSPIVFVGLVAFAAWTLWYEWKGGRWTAKLWALLILISSLIILWVAIAFRLIGFGTTF